MYRALLGSAVAKEADRDLISAFCFCHKGGAAGEWRSSANDTVGTNHTFVQVGNVHRSALALTHSGSLAKQLRHHTAHLYPLGGAVTMAPVGTRHVVFVGQVSAEAHGYRFFPGVEVDKAGDLCG